MSRISSNLAKKLVKNYADYKIGTRISESETRGVWFSRSDILDALNSPVNGTVPNGLRFYFGAYESFQPTRPPRHSLDAGKITLVIVPTTVKTDDTTGNVIMHPYRTTEILPFDLLVEPNAEARYDIEFLKEVNDGQICPPPPVLI